MTSVITPNQIHNQLPRKDVCDNITSRSNSEGVDIVENLFPTTVMQREINRIKTFEGWPVPFISGELLARNGFFYTRKDDIVQCAFCNIELGQWEQGDAPDVDHRRWAPHCAFVRGVECGNIPMSGSGRLNEKEADTCGKYGILQRPNSCPEDSPLEGGITDISKKFNILTKSAVFKQYATLAARLKSFVEWPVSIKQKPNELAEAGFYYTGKSDHVMCFFCGGGLRNWLENDVPWEQHAQWFPQCGFVQIHQTPDYIKQFASNGKTAVLNPNQTNDNVPSKPSSSSSNVKEEKKVKESDGNTKESTDDEPICKICYSKPVGIVFLPCGHYIACIDCAPTQNKCAICRMQVHGTVRAYLS